MPTNANLMFASLSAPEGRTTNRLGILHLVLMCFRINNNAIRRSVAFRIWEECVYLTCYRFCFFFIKAMKWLQKPTGKGLKVSTTCICCYLL